MSTLAYDSEEWMQTAEPMEWLQEYFQMYPLQKKILLAKSFAQGHQWLERLARSGRPLANVQVQTIQSLVLNHTRFALHRADIQHIDSGRTYWFIHTLMHECSKEPDCYIPLELIQPGVVGLMHQAIMELRMAGVKSRNLMVESFMDVHKGSCVKQLLGLYEEVLSEQRLVDFVGLNDYIRPVTGNIRYLVLPEALPDHASREMLQKLTGACDELPIGIPFHKKESGFPAEQSELFHASSAIAEVREVFRRMMNRYIPLDQAEVIASDYTKYAGIFYTLGHAHGIPCTFAEGLPLEMNAAGRTALKLLDWMDNDYPIEFLVTLLRDGSMTFKSYDEAGTGYKWAGVLESLGIGRGRERYDRLLEPDSSASEFEQQSILSLKRVFQKIWSFLPDTDAEGWKAGSVIRAAAAIVDHFGSVNDEEDASVKKQLCQAAESFAGMPEVQIPRDLAIRYARESISKIRTFVSLVPVPGKLHISSLTSGGISGRENTFLVGMDERSWTSSSRQDPILLDEERARISPVLQTAANRIQQFHHEREGRIGGIRGRITLSFSCYDAAEKEAVHPAFAMLQLYRMKTGDYEADFSNLYAALGQPIGYWSTDYDSLDQGDLWSREMSVPGASRWMNGARAVERAMPALQQGRRAAAARRKDAISEYDGWVFQSSEASADERELPVISASRLEHYARCPMKYYFSYELGLWPKEEVGYDPSAWLRPDQRGTLLHEVYYRYMAAAARDSERRIIHDREQLRAISDEVIAHFAATIPSPSVFLFEKECRELNEDIEVFYRRELVCLDTPVLFEQSLTIDGEPLTVQLDAGVRIRMKGFVDRIDQLGPHQYRIIDYKTGNPNKFGESSYFNAGTQLQHALYAAAAEEWMRQTGFDEQAVVTESAYLFPSVRGQGEQVVKLQNRRSELAHLVGLLLESMRSGVYVPTNDPARCKWCDYNQVCGQQAEWMEEKRSAADNYKIIRTLLEVESIE